MLTDTQKTKLRTAITNHPHHAEMMVKRMRERGLNDAEIDDIFEGMPIDPSIELKEFMKGGISGLTLGMKDAPRDPRAGDVEVFGHSVSPSRIGGETLGTIPYALAGVGAAAKVIPAVKLAGKMKLPLQVARKGIEHAVGSAAPGFISGYVMSDGSVDHAMKSAGIWLASGIIGEGVFRLMGTAFRKIRNGQATKLTPPEKEAVNKFRDIRLRVRPDPVTVAPAWGKPERSAATIQDKIPALRTKVETDDLPDEVFFDIDPEDLHVRRSVTDADKELDSVLGRLEEENIISKAARDPEDPGPSSDYDQEEASKIINEHRGPEAALGPAQDLPVSHQKSIIRSAGGGGGWGNYSADAIPYPDLSDIAIKEVGNIAEGVAARYKDGTILLNLKLLRQKWDEKAWTKPRIEGVDPLPENQFKSYAEWEKFTVLHEWTHSVMEKGRLSRAEYENRINQTVLKEMESTWIPKGAAKADTRLYGDAADPKDMTADEAEFLMPYGRSARPARGGAPLPGEEAGRWNEAHLKELETPTNARGLNRPLTKEEQIRIAEHPSSPRQQFREDRAFQKKILQTAQLVETLKPGEVVQLAARVRTGLGGKIFNGYVQSVEPGLLEIVQSGKHIWIPIDDITAIKPAEISKEFAAVQAKIRKTEPDGTILFADLSGTPSARGGDVGRQERVAGLMDRLSRGDEPLGGTPPARGGADSPSGSVPKSLQPIETISPMTEGQRKSIYRLEAEFKRRTGKDYPNPLEWRDGWTAGKARIHEENMQLEMWRLKEAELNHTIETTLMDAVDPRHGDYYHAWPKAERVKGKVKLGRPERIVPDEDAFREPSFPWMMKVLSPNSKFGMSTNPIARKMIHSTFFMIEELRKRSAIGLEKYREIIKPINASGQKLQRLKGALQKGAPRDEVNLSVKNKVHLIRALDGGNAEVLIRQNPEIKAPYFELRGLINSYARQLELPPDLPLTDYFVSLFSGRVGIFQANSIAAELGPKARFLRTTGEGKRAAFEEFFEKLRTRKQGEAFAYDLDASMYVFIRAATQRPLMDKFLKASAKTLKELPATNKDGTTFSLPAAFKDWTNHVIGRPTPTRQAVARFWRDNELFNQWVDSAVEIVGDAESRGILALARRGGAAAGETGGRVSKGFSSAEEAPALNFFERLTQEANVWTRKGELAGTPKMKRYRAQVALKISELRAALTNPNARPFIIESLFRLMVVNKLGLNAAHGIVNTTQTLTNTMPLVGLTYMTRGVRKYMSNTDEQYKTGWTANEVLEDSGVLHDAPAGEEFLTSGLGLMNDITDAAMTPARLSEQFNRGVALLAKYEQGIDKGLSHGQAVAEAVELVQRTQFPFNRAGAMPFMRSPFWRLMFMFKSYTIHQMNFSAELLEQAVKGDPAPFFKHMLAYISLAGAGGTFLGFTNLGERTSHPITSFTPSEINKWGGISKSLGGPPASSLVDVLHGQYSQALRQWTDPTYARRIRRAAGNLEEPGEAVLQATGLAPTPF